ncbi:cyclodeaminase/cyclohydrolase family protein [Thermodesulfobacteriota bacterium]
MTTIKLADLKVKDLLKEISSDVPIPGGGSVAALSGAISSSLVEMFANLSLRKTENKEIAKEMRNVAEEVSKFNVRFVEDIDNDSDAYFQVVEAYKLPKGNQEEKEKRFDAIQQALKHATLVPLGVAQLGFKLMDMAGSIMKEGNKNAITDAAVAVMMARTSIISALYNVKINLLSIKDDDFVEETYNQVCTMQKATLKRENDILKDIVDPNFEGNK